MRLYKGSATGEAITAIPFTIDMTDLVEGTDYWLSYLSRAPGEIPPAGVDDDGIYTIEDGSKTYKTIGISFYPNPISSTDVTTAVRDAIQGLPQATNLAWSFNWQIQEGIGGPYIETEIIDAGSPKPADYDVHWLDLYYRQLNYIPDYDNAEGYYAGNRPINGTWDGTKRYKVANTNLFWTPSGGCFGAGVELGQSGSNVVATYFAGYQAFYNRSQDSVHRFDFKKAGISSLATNMMVPDVYATNYPFFNPCCQEIITPASMPYEDTKNKVALCSFKYKDIGFIGVAVVQMTPDDLVSRIGVWACSEDWWNAPGSKEYYVDAEGTVQKQKNTGWTKSKWTPEHQYIPSAADNPVLHMAGSKVVKYGITSGWLTYVFEKSDYDKFVADIANPKLTTISSGGTQGDMTHGTQSGASKLSSLYSDPFSALINVYTLPINSNLFALTGDASDYVRCGGLICSDIVETNKVLGDRAIQIPFFCSKIRKKSCGYLNYTNTKASVYIPMYGLVPLNLQTLFQMLDDGDSDCVLYLDYTLDALTGNFTFDLSVWLGDLSKGASLMTGSGNMLCPFPIIGSSNILERAMSGVSSALKNTFNVVASPTASNAYGAMVNTFGAMENGLSQHQAYSQLGGAPEMFSGQYRPYLMFERPITPQQSFIGAAGYPSAATGTVSVAAGEIATGFNSYRSVDLSGITSATKAEKAEIESILKEGIWIMEGGE